MADIKIEMTDYMGSDLKVCQMAKDSFGRTTDWDRMDCDCGWTGIGSYCPICDCDSCVGVLSDRDQRLLKMLARGMGDDEYEKLQSDIVKAAAYPDYSEAERLLWKFRHTTPHLAPFGHNFATFKFQAPVFVMRQIVKHEYIRISELSMRYVRGMPEYFRPKSWRAMADDVKQGSGGDHDDQLMFSDWMDLAEYDDSELYDHALLEELAPEQARMFLRLCHMTQGHLSGSMDALAGLVIKRLDPHAQEETREFARQIDKAMSKVYPLSWAALMEGVDRN